MYAQTLVKEIERAGAASWLAGGCETKRLEPHQSAIATSHHEAGHVIAYAHCGVAVREVQASLYFGACLRPDTAPPEADILATTAGYIASRMAGACDGPSGADHRVMKEAMAPLGIAHTPRFTRWREEQAAKFCTSHWREITWLAGRLRAAGKLSYPMLGSLCREYGSPLKPYAHLYRGLPITPRRASTFLRDPEEPRAAKTEYIGPTCPNGGIWSEEKQCYLRRRKGRGPFRVMTRAFP